MNKTMIFSLMLVVLAFLTANAMAAMQAVGPTNPVTTLPTWYMDGNNLPLAPCVDQNKLCILPPPFDPTLPDPNFPALFPITTTGPINDNNYPGEGFYYSAFAADPLGGAGKFTIENGEVVIFGYVLEFAFLSGVIPETGITFLRTDLQKMRKLTPNATYRLTHPYGQFTFQTDAAGVTIDAGPGTRFEDQSGSIANYLPPLFKSAPNTNIGPFLTPVGGAASFITDPLDNTKVYIGDPVIPVKVTGGQNNVNFVRIERLNAQGIPVASWQTDYFTLMGRVYTQQIPSPLNIDRASYARDANGGQIDIFATAKLNAALSLTGTGITAGNLTPETPAAGKFFTHIPFTGSTLPSSLVLTNSLDVPAIPYPITLVDEVIISQAFFNPVTRDLTIKARSRDMVAPVPTLSVPALPAPNTLDASGVLVKSIAGTIPPLTVSVSSSRGGVATAPVSVIVPPAPPVAVDDSARMTANTTVKVVVLANDTTAGSLDPTSIAIGSQNNGTAVVNPDGTVTFIPAADFTGQGSFTYTVKDVFNQISNSATVTVTVLEGSATTALIAVADQPSPHAIGTPVTFVATRIGGPVNNEYRFWLNSGSGFVVAQDYGPANSWTWTPSAAGAYDILVDVRAEGTTVVRDALKAINFYQIVASSTPATGVTLVPDVATPQAAGTPITFTATGTGGSGTYDYRFWVNDGAGFLIARDYTTSNTFVWTPTKPGIYDIMVDVRNTGTNVLRDTFQKLFQYQIQYAPASGVSVTVDKTSPQAAGTPVVFTAAGSGGSGSYEYRFWLNSGAGYNIVQTYSTLPTWTWTNQATGTYDLMVDVRSLGSTAVREASTNVFQYQIQPPAATGVTVSVDKASPQTAGTPIVFTANATGGTGSYEYRFWLNSGAGYTVVQNYSTVPTWTWTNQTAGTHDIMVDVRSAGSTVARDASTNVFQYQIQPVAATGVTVSADKASPQTAGTPVVFTANATGGTGSYEYRFWLNSGAGYSVVQNYSTVPTWTWTNQTAGTYDLMVDVRSVGSTAIREASTNLFQYQIQPAPATGVTVSTDKASPQTAGTPVVFTAAGSGGTGPYEYRFWLNSGAGYSVVQEYSTLPTWTWTNQAAGTYDILVDVRTVGSVAVRDALEYVFFYQVL